jgi:nucleoside-diphosphate-sugar epimerase
MVSGKMHGIPRIGLEIVDVRDLVDVHIRAMTSPQAAGQRLLATGEFLWMREVACTLTTEKARLILGWQARPARQTVLDCAKSLIAHGVA